MEGQWVWSDGSAVDYTNWDTGEPNNWMGDEDCALFWSGGERGKWHDGAGRENCNAALGYLCRTSPAQSTATIVGIAVGGGGGLLLLIIIVVAVCACKKPNRAHPAATPTAGGVPLQDLGRPGPSQTSSVPVIADARLVPMGGGARFDVNTGQPIPKFDPNTGRQNWWDESDRPAQAVPVQWGGQDAPSYGKSVV